MFRIFPIFPIDNSLIGHRDPDLKNREDIRISDLRLKGVDMAHTKAKGSTKLGRDSESKRLGVKIFGGQKIAAGQIIVRQKGTKYHPGKNVGVGRDRTIFAKAAGQVVFVKKSRPSFSGQNKKRVFVSVATEKPKL